eukprot:169874-Chlamydomonas_euryale.AAC.2
MERLGVSVNGVVVFVRVMMERLGISGHVSIVVGDVVAGVLCGAGIMAATCGGVLPLVAYSVS